ncbi:ABC transporter permease subunit [Thermosyntropha sp.]|uniref:ABC transporter permease subunit n=1 Tax=Thermosyntropha sp. TaxID=2740820 RepID=UPI0025D79D06|nr:ABC transporter permease subunit [Thermosyntropha sp.]MBO8158773.1 ABC transporter permease subunit [Thermosyntropha sp.]
MKNIVRLTFREIINKKILHIGIILTLIYLIFYGVGLHYLVKNAPAGGGMQALFMQEVGFELLTFGLFISSFLTGTLAIMLGVGSISHEVESGTVLFLASKPIKRSSIIMGKFGVYAFSTALHAGVLAGAVMALSIYFFRLSVSWAGVTLGVLIFMLIPVCLLAPVFLGSTLMSSMANGVSMFVLYSLAIIGGMMEQIGAIIHKTGLVNMGIISSLILPVDALFRLTVSKISDFMEIGIMSQLGPFGTVSVPSTAMLFYTLIYIMVLLVLTVYFFNNKDLS